MSPSQIHMQLQVDTKCTLFQSSSFPIMQMENKWERPTNYITQMEDNRQMHI